jgi:hypothetical protein
MDAITKAEIERKARLGIPLSGDQNGNVSSADLAYYQQLMTAQQQAQQHDSSNQVTGGGVGGTSVPYVPYPDTSYPGNATVPTVTNQAVTGYGFSAIVALGVGLIVMSLVSSFRRVRGR